MGDKRAQTEVFCEGDKKGKVTGSPQRSPLSRRSKPVKDHAIWSYASEIISVICQIAFVCCQSVTASRQLRGVDGSYRAWRFLALWLPLVTETRAAAHVLSVRTRWHGTQQTSKQIIIKETGKQVNMNVCKWVINLPVIMSNLSIIYFLGFINSKRSLQPHTSEHEKGS